MKPYCTEHELIADIKARADKFESHLQAARYWGVSRSMLCEVLKGRKGPGTKLLKAIGMERVVSYRVVEVVK